jgi:hypothetical protein
MGDRPLPGIAAEDIGRSALGIFRRGAALIDKRVGIAGEHLTGAQMAAAMASALQRPVSYNPVTPEQYRSFGFPGADDLGNMFQFKHDFNRDFCAPRDVVATRALNPQLQNFETWLKGHAALIPLT